MTAIKSIDWDGLPAIQLKADSFEAVLLPNNGANLIELTFPEMNCSLLRTPRTSTDFLEKPVCYGIPILMPPNRIDNGRFSFAGRDYEFPLNEEERSNHIHGFLYDQKWEIVKQFQGSDEVEIEVLFESTEKSSFYNSFPHDFKFSLIYNLSKNGLKQTVSVLNTGPTAMPLCLGYHIAFNTPFHRDSGAEDCIVQLPLNKRWELSERFLPTGHSIELDQRERQFVDVGFCPSKQKISGHYSGKPCLYKGQDFYGAIIKDLKQNLAVKYEVDPQFGHWVLWNDGGAKNFFCPEPQTCMINAPNLSESISGLISLKPKDTFSANTSICLAKQ